MWWVATRLMLLVVSYISLTFLSTPHPQGRPTIPTNVTLAYTVSRWTLWDGNVYRAIALGNYHTSITAAFFPLYPLLIRIAMVFTGTSKTQSFAAALLVGNLGTLGAFFGVGLLAARERKLVAAASGSLRVLAAYPLASFLAAAYTDGLFLGLACGALVCARRGSWYWAALWAFLAGLTRPTAVILILPLVWEYFHQRMPRRTLPQLRAVPRLALVVGAVPLALASYSVYCAIHFHDPLAYLHAQARYNIRAQWPWQTIFLIAQQLLHASSSSFVHARILVDTLPVCAIALICVVGWRTRPAAMSLYLVGLILLTLSSPIVGAQFPDAIAGAGRFMLAAAPAWLDLGRWSVRSPWLDTLLVSGGFAVQALLVAFVLTGGWLI
ncbi:MAG TPA: hypothetical protein VGN32_20335 [Ktedonobacterales bacterium]|nr:hypothetical protein [Ktedonobacterales bacterium]